MGDKREVFDLLMRSLSRPRRMNEEHLRCIADSYKLVSDFKKYDFVEYQRPEYYADCLSKNDIPPIDPVTTNLPPELASVILLLQAELKNQRQSLAASNRLMTIFSEQLHIALDNCENCASCRALFAKSLLRTVKDKGIVKSICEGCFDREYFDCNKCKRTLPISEQGEEDDQRGYGWLCKDCVKPIGFPQSIVIAPDFEGCESIAAADFNTLCKEASRATCGHEPESGDTTELKFVEMAKSNVDKYAVYRSKSGLKCEIGELDWRGIGSLYIYEEQDEDDSDA